MLTKHLKKWCLVAPDYTAVKDGDKQTLTLTDFILLKSTCSPSAVVITFIVYLKAVEERERH